MSQPLNRLGRTKSEQEAVNRAARKGWSPLPNTPLTPREREVLAACLLGTRYEAAARLGIAWYTVRAHMRDICIRLQVEDRVEAARAMGWLRIPDEYITGPVRVDGFAGAGPVVR